MGLEIFHIVSRSLTSSRCHKSLHFLSLTDIRTLTLVRKIGELLGRNLMTRDLIVGSCMFSVRLDEAQKAFSKA